MHATTILTASLTTALFGLPGGTEFQAGGPGDDGNVDGKVVYHWLESDPEPTGTHAVKAFAAFEGSVGPGHVGSVTFEMIIVLGGPNGAPKGTNEWTITRDPGGSFNFTLDHGPKSGPAGTWSQHAYIGTRKWDSEMSAWTRARLDDDLKFTIIGR